MVGGDFSLDITLNRMGYKHEDMTDLFQEPFDTIYSTKIGYQWHPSVVGWDSIMIAIIISYPLKGIADGFLSQVGADLSTWAREALSKVIKRRNNFDNSSIHIQFEDQNICIYVNNGDEIVESIQRVEKIIKYLQDSDEFKGNSIDLYFEKLKEMTDK